jgi:hypothetical protein
MGSSFWLFGNQLGSCDLEGILMELKHSVFLVCVVFFLLVDGLDLKVLILGVVC